MVKQSKCTVKWFNSKNRFGFFILPDGRDVFVHRKRLVTDNVPRGSMINETPAEIVYEEDDDGRLRTISVLWVGEDPIERKGRKVRRKKREPKPDPLKVGDRVSVRIKSYNPDRGFGFAKPIGKNHPDLFFHISAVPTDLKEYVVVRQVFDAAVGENDRGLTAVIFQLHEEAMAAE